jgi:DNA polymerase I-like protein with 3'-5' exonuclease and polymerase domains
MDPRVKACKAGYARAKRAAEKENRTRLAREQIAAAKQQKRDEAEEGRVQLPAVVLRDGTVKEIHAMTAVEIIEQYLEDLCLDTETSGYWVGHQYYELRTVQLGGEEMAVVLDAADEKQAMIASWALNAAGRIWAHSVTADAVPCVVAGLISWDDIWDKLHDSVIRAKLTDPMLCGSEADKLKQLAQDLLREYAVSPSAEEAKDKLFAVMKCLKKTDNTTPPERNGWHQVSKFATVMVRYAGSDVLDLAAVLRVLPPLPVGADVMERERIAQKVCARAAMDGFPLDFGHIRAKIAEAEAGHAEARETVEKLTEGRIVNPSASKEVLEYLLERPAEFPLKCDRKTKKPTAGKESLEPIAKRGSELARSIVSYRGQVTKLGLLLRPLENLCTHGDSMMRPTVYTINAKTGRMSCVRPNGQQFCYTSDMDILTDQGWKAFPELDGSEHVAQWAEGIIEFVVPEAVTHQPYDGTMIRIKGEHHEQLVTPNHRVYSKTRDGKLMVERADSWLKHGTDDKIVDRKFIRGGRLKGRKLNDAERLALYRAVAVQADGYFAADRRFVSIKITKQRKADRARELGFEVRTTPNTAGGKVIMEAKAYEADCVPWLSMPSKTFSIPALLELDSSELDGFLSEVMIWDGDSTRCASYNQALSRADAVDAVEMAAFLSGHSTCRSFKRVDGREYANVQVFPKAERWASRTNVTEEDSDGMVHCVTVSSGAVVVRCNGKVIVSGNSRQGGIRACVRAGEAFLALRDGQWEIVPSGGILTPLRGISADFEGCEIRVAAALSGDRGLYEAETSNQCRRCGEFVHPDEYPDGPQFCACGEGKEHLGLHWLTAHTAHGPEATKEHRYQAKRGTFTRLFGGGPATAADQVGCDIELMQQVWEAFNSVAPAYTQWDTWLRMCYEKGTRMWRDYSTGTNFSQEIPGTARHMVYQTYSGRNVYVTNGAHAAGNGAIQGTARELLIDGLIRWSRTRWGKLPLLPIHDEIDVLVPADEAHEATRALQNCMRSTVLSSPGFEVMIGADTDEPWESWPDSS